MSTAKITRLALSLTLLIIASQLVIPIQPVPITLQTLAVVVIGGILSPIETFIIMLSYLLIGLIGLPVFAGFSGGMNALLTPSFGFALSFLVSAPIFSTLLHKRTPWQWGRFVLAAAVHYLITYSLGLLYLAGYLYYTTGSFPGMIPLLLMGLVPFCFGDLIKYILSGIIIKRLQSAIHSTWFTQP
ncbi:MAG: biotin transporter BioY [Aerococcus sp.]|nr:biotin transporter BioY [Aerococcus sp.]